MTDLIVSAVVSPSSTPELAYGPGNSVYRDVSATKQVLRSTWPRQRVRRGYGAYFPEPHVALAP